MPGMYVNTNISSLNAQGNLLKAQSSLQSSMQRLSSGMRINSAADDAAGNAVSTRMTSQINAMAQAKLNATDAISLTQTADGGMNSIVKSLQSMRTLAVQASNSTYSASDRASMNAQVKQLKSEIDRIAGGTNFNGINLLDGSFNQQSFQVGAYNGANDSIQIESISSLKTADIGGVGTSNVAMVNGAKPTAALSVGDLTINGVAVGASKAGAMAGQSASSAFSVARAINAANTGVTATADVNTVEGTSGPTSTGAIAAGTFSVNGVKVGAITDGLTASGQGANIAAAINKVSTQSGVTATSDATTGKLTLTASDGRDVAITLNNADGIIHDGATATTDRNDFLAKTGLNSANVGTQDQNVATSVASGFLGGSAHTFTNGTTASYSMSIDSKAFISVATGASLSAADLDTQWAAFNSSPTLGNNQYTLTGTFADGTAQITKKDGTALVITDTSTAAAVTPGFSDGFVGKTTANTTSNSTSVTKTFTSAAADGVGQTFKLSIDGHDMMSTTSTSTNDTVSAADLDTAWTTFKDTDVGKSYTATGTFAGGDFKLTKKDGSNIAVSLNSTYGSFGTGAAGSFAAGSNFLGTTNSKGTGATSTVVSGAFTSATSSASDQTFDLQLDGNSVFSKTSTATNSTTTVTAAELDQAWSDFSKTNAGASYSLSGSFQTDDAVITKKDGTAINLKIVSNFGTGTSSFATSGFTGVTSGTQKSATQFNHGSISLDTTAEAGISVGGTHTAYAGLQTGVTKADPATSTTITTIAEVDVSNRAGAQAAISAIDGAISTVNENQGYIGAMNNRFSSALDDLQTSSVNLSSARMGIRDVDFASETAAMTKSQVLSQASMAILGQANQAPNQVMSLLR